MPLPAPTSPPVAVSAALRPPVLAPAATLILQTCLVAVAVRGAALAGDPMLSIVASLAVQHQEQWTAEDRSRASTTVAEKAAVKARIDVLNDRRAELVAELDDVVAARMPAAAAEVPLHTETVGSVVDRLVIAWVRADRLSGDRGRQARWQLRELAGAYDVLLAEVAAGARRVPVWTSLKCYGGTDPVVARRGEAAK